MWWVNFDPGPAEDTVADDMKVFGVVDFQPPGWMAEPDNDDLAVLPENWDAVQVFLHCGTQWRLGPKGQPTGLSYASLEIVMQRLRVADPDDAWLRVRVMEQAALKEFARQRS